LIHTHITSSTILLPKPTYPSTILAIKNVSIGIDPYLYLISGRCSQGKKGASEFSAEHPIVEATLSGPVGPFALDGLPGQIDSTPVLGSKLGIFQSENTQKTVSWFGT